MACLPVRTLEKVTLPALLVVDFCDPSTVTRAPFTGVPLLSFTWILSGTTLGAVSSFPDGLGVADGDGVGVVDGEADGVGVTLAGADGDGLDDGFGIVLPIGDGDGICDGVGGGEGDGDGEGDGGTGAVIGIVARIFEKLQETVP
jgi:hypothetical protein